MSVDTHPVRSPNLHRIHHGSPIKISTQKRLFALAERQHTSVWKARRVEAKEELKVGEVFITHVSIHDDAECVLALARMGVSETVLVAEGLSFLAREADVFYQSLSSIREFKSDVEMIMCSVKSHEMSFCKFSYAIYMGCKEEDQLYDAISRTGMKLFWEVLESLAIEHPNNGALQWISTCEGDDEIIPLQGLSRMFRLVHERNQKSHPYAFIGEELQLAKKALDVFRYLSEHTNREKFEDTGHLMKATIPII